MGTVAAGDVEEGAGCCLKLDVGAKVFEMLRCLLPSFALTGLLGPTKVGDCRADCRFEELLLVLAYRPCFSLADCALQQASAWCHLQPIPKEVLCLACIEKVAYMSYAHLGDPAADDGRLQFSGTASAVKLKPSSSSFSRPSSGSGFPWSILAVTHTAQKMQALREAWKKRSNSTACSKSCLHAAMARMACGRQCLGC
jgi:hypothetical protein